MASKLVAGNVPLEVYDWIKHLASTNNTSMSQTVKTLLNQAYSVSVRPTQKPYDGTLATDLNKTTLLNKTTKSHNGYFTTSEVAAPVDSDIAQRMARLKLAP